MSEIKVNPDELQEKAQSIESIAAAIQAAVDEVDAEISRMNAGVFAGQRAEALRGHYMAQKSSIEEFAPFLRQFSDMLQIAAEAFRQADTPRS